jgi:hypothetical protein
MRGDNTESNKKHAFSETFESYLVDLVGDHLSFYNKMKEPKRNSFVKDKLYEKYSKAISAS